MLMHKILQNRLLCAFVANLKIDAIYALYLESFCDKNLASRKVFAFCDSVFGSLRKDIMDNTNTLGKVYLATIISKNSHQVQVTSLPSVVLTTPTATPDTS